MIAIGSAILMGALQFEIWAPAVLAVLVIVVDHKTLELSEEAFRQYLEKRIGESYLSAERISDISLNNGSDSF